MFVMWFTLEGKSRKKNMTMKETLEKKHIFQICSQYTKMTERIHWQCPLPYVPRPNEKDISAVQTTFPKEDWRH